jgi:two-component system NtrC family sensor kinase
VSESASDHAVTTEAVNVPTLRSRLFHKYVTLFILPVWGGLFAGGALDIWIAYQDQTASLIRIQHEQADAAAGKIGQFVRDIQAQLGWTTQLPWLDYSLEEQRFDSLRLLRLIPAITELARLDPSGRERVRVSRLTETVIGGDADRSGKPEFIEAMAHKAYYGPVYFRRETEPFMTLAVTGPGMDLGVTVAEISLKYIWDVVSGIKVGNHGAAYVVDANGKLIAHPDLSLVLRNTDLSGLAQVRPA